MKKLVKAIAGLSAAGILAVSSATFYYSQSLPDQYYVVEGNQLSFNSALSINASKPAGEQAVSFDAVGTGSVQTQTLKLFGVIPIKEAKVNVVSQKMLVPCGSPFGVKMFTEGVMVVGINEVDTADGKCNPAKDCGIKLGDSIIRINGQEVSSNEDIAAIVLNSDGNSLSFEIKRNDNVFEQEITPVKSTFDGTYKVGIWVRDSSAGIGTLTFYDPDTGVFGGLGHAVTDVDTGEVLTLSSGEIVDVSIEGVTKGQIGNAGELQGSFASGTIGQLLLNSETGVFGVADTDPVSTQAAMPLGMKQEIEVGAATIYTTIDGSGPQEYEISIQKINLGDDTLTKNMIIKVTDSSLIEKAGGIVQGMSGSPIMQNGKIIGAVTHVFINDPTKGYAIFAENMYNYAKTVDGGIEGN